MNVTECIGYHKMEVVDEKKWLGKMTNQPDFQTQKTNTTYESQQSFIPNPSQPILTESQTIFTQSKLNSHLQISQTHNQLYSPTHNKEKQNETRHTNRNDMDDQ